MENDGMVKHLREVPETDAAPVVHSRFINMGGYPACEHCGWSQFCRDAEALCKSLGLDYYIMAFGLRRMPECSY